MYNKRFARYNYFILDTFHPDMLHIHNSLTELVHEHEVRLYVSSILLLNFGRSHWEEFVNY
jgi:hypothetical protein